MASSSAPPNIERQMTTTPILEESKRLCAVQSLLSELWQDEVNLYEHSSSAIGIGDGGDDDHHETRNRPNCSGTVENETLFPYHTALYPLLDCYDSIRDDKQDSSLVVRPSPAPMPFEFNGHRRSKFSPRLDRHGIQIEELAALEGHLPNSAWAIKQLMPHNRKAQFMECESSSCGGTDSGTEDNNDEDVQPPPQAGEMNGNNIHDEASRHNNNRFWNVLMNPFSGANSPFSAGSDGMSVPPNPEDNVNLLEEDAAEAEGGDDEEWEDVDDDYEDAQNIESGEIRATASKYARDFTFLGWWQRSIVKERRGVINNEVEASKMPSLDVPVDSSSLKKPSSQEYSPESLYESSPSSATFILLRVLKHSLSDLQREFRLARAVVLLIADWRLCDCVQEEAQQGDGSAMIEADEGGGIECLRRLLSIVSSEYIAPCGGYCHEWYISNGGISDNDDEFEDVLDDSAVLSRPNHYCSDWWEFLGSLSTLLSHGITHMTREHANVLCSFVIQLIHRASTSAVPTGGDDGAGEVQSGKAYLKQNIYFLNNAEQSEAGLNQDGAGCQKISTNLILTILSALRQHAVSDRMKLIKLLDALNSSDTIGDQGGNDIMSLEISKTLKSFQNCIYLTVDIGERCLLRLPTNVPARSVGGMIVRSLVESYVDSDKFSLRADKPLSYLAPESDSRLRSLIDPRRYSDAVANASNNPLLDPSRSRGLDVTGCRSIEQLIGFQPPKDVQDIVKALFMRDLVDLQVSGCGYGDFLSWCRLPIAPEPLLVDYISNFPNNLSSAAVQQHNHWVIDEDGTELDHAHLSARYDFSLLVFFRQWNSPWTPESHLSFSIPHRRAISTLALCAHRYHMPADIVTLVNSFLPRSWWPDDRRCCWCRDCQLHQVKQDFQSKISSRQSNWDSQEGQASYSNLDQKKMKKSLALITCPGCQVAMACSKDHLKYLHQDGHKRYCGLPPFRKPFSAEDNHLCREIFKETEEICLLANEVDENEGGEEDEIDEDDGSWESVDSDYDLEEAASKSDVIFSFFNDKSYKLQRREALPFANFF